MKVIDLSWRVLNGAIPPFQFDSSDLIASQSRLRAAFFVCKRRNRVKVISG